MKHSILGTVFSIFIVSIIVMILSFVSDDSYKSSKADASQDSIIKDVETQDSSQNQNIYILKEYDGKLAVFRENQSKPYQVFNVYVKTLPAFDQGQLKQGIHVDGDDELSSLIEDYIS